MYGEYKMSFSFSLFPYDHRLRVVAVHDYFLFVVTCVAKQLTSQSETHTHQYGHDVLFHCIPVQ